MVEPRDTAFTRLRQVLLVSAPRVYVLPLCALLMGCERAAPHDDAVDMRASKSIPLRGRVRLDVLAQAFNLFDTTNLQAQFGGGRVSNALSPSFGRILTARPARQVELAAKVLW